MQRRDVGYRCFRCCEEARQKDGQKDEQTRCPSDGGSGARREGDATVAHTIPESRSAFHHGGGRRWGGNAARPRGVELGER